MSSRLDPSPRRPWNKWDRRFVEVAAGVSKWSKDPDKRVGALVVSPDGRRVSWGYNGLPAGLADSPERLGNTALKLELTVHAELNALLNCPDDVSGWTLYTTEFPCLGCALSIMQSGVAEVVAPFIFKSSSWRDSQHKALLHLLEAGVRVIQYDRKEVLGWED